MLLRERSRLAGVEVERPDAVAPHGERQGQRAHDPVLDAGLAERRPLLVLGSGRDAEHLLVAEGVEAGSYPRLVLRRVDLWRRGIGEHGGGGLAVPQDRKSTRL